MADVLVSLATAVICFSSQCFPVLVGEQTPIGQYELSLMRVEKPMYGGSILAFAEDDTGVFAVHRVLPIGNRLKQIAEDDPKKRRGITNGCINVQPDVYEKLMACCTNSDIIVIE